MKYLDEVAGDARIMGAVNTVYVKEGRLCGENTDGKGFITSLKEEQIEMDGRTAMLLGAGGRQELSLWNWRDAGVKKAADRQPPGIGQGNRTDPAGK